MFDSRNYEVRKKNSIGRKYEVLEGGEVILDSRDEQPDLRKGFELFATNGDEAVEISDEQVLDVSTSFTVRADGNVIGGFKRHWSFFSHRWRIINDQNRELAEARERSRFLSLLNRFISGIFPLKYRIFHGNESVAVIDGKLSTRGRYEVEIQDKEKIDPRLVVSLAIVIDVVEGL